jgi:hypothetical protein
MYCDGVFILFFHCEPTMMRSYAQAAIAKLALAATQPGWIAHDDVAHVCMEIVLRIGFVWPTKKRLREPASQALRSVEMKHFASEGQHGPHTHLISWFVFVFLNFFILFAFRSICKFRGSMVSHLLKLLDVTFDEPDKPQIRGPELLEIIQSVLSGLDSWSPTTEDQQWIAKWLDQPIASSACTAAQVTLTDVDRFVLKRIEVAGLI